MENGVFLDVGAHNGITYSNTYFFEQELQWDGLCIEPIPTAFDLLRANRICRCINACATTAEETEKDFLWIVGQYEMLSGLIDCYEPKHMQMIQRALQRSKSNYKIIKVPCNSLNRMLQEEKIDHIHYLSMDTEGGEYDLLLHFDFAQCFVDVISVEDNYQTYPWEQMMKEKGFEFVARLNQDLVFVHSASKFAKLNPRKDQ